MRNRTPPSSPPPVQERSILDLILEIKEGTANPHLISAEDRQACVAHLGAEGLSVPEIAQFLKRNERTITRDRKALQEAAALEHDPSLAGRFAGQLLGEATLCIDRIRRVSRDRDTPPAVKVDAERSCFGIMSDLVQRLQSLGYLPTATQRLQADLTHNIGEIPTFEVLQAEVKRVTHAAAMSGDVPPEVKQLEEVVARAALAAQVEAAGSKTGKEVAP